jgi:hypothetical protein
MRQHIVERGASLSACFKASIEIVGMTNEVSKAAPMVPPPNVVDQSATHSLRGDRI